jgi:mono/diheme cytochrome c family protein
MTTLNLMRPYFFSKLVLFINIVLFTASLAAAQTPDAALKVGAGAQALAYSRGALLTHPSLKEITVENDAAYHKTMHYLALPISALLPNVGQMASVQFVAEDGFVANIPGALLASDAQAWLAIEPTKTPWPVLKPGSPATAGPFYLVWLHPEKSGVSNEQWPYQIARIQEAPPLQSRYPQMLPQAAAGSAELRGYKVFAANCASCHKINGGGDAMVGPDLNLPANPTEYFQTEALRKLIRDPGSLRRWPGSIMPGFAPAALSESDLDDLLAYLRQMAKQRP